MHTFILIIVFVLASVFFSWPKSDKSETLGEPTGEIVSSSSTDSVIKFGDKETDAIIDFETTVVNEEEKEIANAYKITKSISYNSVTVDVVIDKPTNNAVDVLVVYHGTSMDDDKAIEASDFILNKFKNLLDRKDLMIVSVAYPEENLLLGDNITQAEAALLWVKNNAADDLGIKINKIFLAGHSQGAYLVTRLNTMHETDGVVANAPGPLSLEYRCRLEETKKIPEGITCNLLNDAYGTTLDNPNAYAQRSLLNFTDGYKSDILFVQGLNDSRIQMYSWPSFKEAVLSCSDCKETQFLELTGEGHGSLFSNAEAKIEFNKFIISH